MQFPSASQGGGPDAARPNQLSFQGNFSPLASGLQQSTNNWVSFDDDSGSGGFSAGAPENYANANGAFAPPFPPAAPAATPLTIPPATSLSPALLAGLTGVPTGQANPGTAAAPGVLTRPPLPAPGAPHAPAAASARPGATHFSPLTSSAAQPSFPTFAAIHGVAAAPGGAAGSLGTAEPGGGVHRLPRPPTSVARAGPPGAASATNPFAAHSSSVPVPPGPVAPAANPFATGVGAQGASAAARSLDPFADLSLKPALPRPPPMRATAGPAPATGLAPATGVGNPVAPPVAAPAQPTHAAPPPPPAPRSVPFPTFASLHQQPVRPWADPSATAAGLTAAASSPLFAASAASTSAPGSPGLQAAVIQTTSFDAFTSPCKVVRPGQQRSSAHPDGAHPPPPSPPRLAPPPSSSAQVVPPASPPPPPPPYEEAVAMSPGLPPPPAYADALAMPPAESLPPPPPPYDEAVAMPAPPPPVSSSASPLPAQVPPPVSAAGPAITTADAHSSWAAFDDGSSSGPASGTTASAGAAPPSLTSGLAPQDSDSRALRRQPSQQAAQPPPLPSQICVEVRLAPLKPKEAAWPKRLVAGMGSAFAAPGGDGVAALQWCLLPGREGAGPGEEEAPRFGLPAGGGAQRAPEDWDSAPAVALPLPPALPDSPVTSMLVDAVSGSLWTGHKDGRVVRWSVGPGRAALYEHHWKAHARGKVTCLALSPWGELWTGSSAGSVRAWQYLGALPASRGPVRLFECRRARLALGAAARAAAQRAHSKARLLALGPSGRVVWSAGRTGFVLWGAYDGEYLGCLTPGQAAGQEARAGAPGQGAYAGDTGAVFRDGGWQQMQQPDEINPQTGLESSVVNRSFMPRAAPDGGDEAEDPDLGAQVIKGLAGAAKFANKLRKRIQKNLVGDAQAGSADGLAGAGEPGFGPANGGGGAAGGARGKVVALVAGTDQSMYVAYKGGVLEKYTEWGRLLWSRDYGRDARLHSAALVGAQLWLGCGDGTVRTVAATTGEPGRSWKAHDFPVVGLAGCAGGGAPGGAGSGLVYSLSENGSVRAWPAAPPTEAHLTAWRDGLLPCLRRRQCVILAGTWNVNETRPSPASLRAWLTPRAAGAEIVAIALQEVEMGTSSVARDAALTLLSKAMLERGNQNAQWWATELAAALAATGYPWVRVALRQMSGLIAVVFCRAELSQFVGEMATANVACGVMGVGGNKGAVAVSMSVFRRRVMFVGSHFAAHQERVEERNDNYNKIVRQLHFDNTSKAAQRQKQQQQAAASATGDGSVRDGGANGGGALDVVTDADLDAAAGGGGAAAAVGAGATEHDEQGPGVSDAEMLVWAGDFNYRVNGFYSDVCALACAGEYAKLFAADQCRAEMEKGTIFRGLREPLPLGHPVFPPTYKYDKGEPALLLAPPAGEAAGRARMRLPYDSSEKQRVPAWTDRIFFRGSRPGSLDVAEEEVQVGVASPHDYNCVMEVNDSDHKPVHAVLQVQLPAYKQDEKRRHSLAAAIAAANHAAQSSDGGGIARQPQRPVQVSASALHVRPNGVAALDLQNTSSCGFLVSVTAERPLYRAPAGHGAVQRGPLPAWLEVSPASFTLMPGQGRDGGDAAQSRARVLMRTLGMEGSRVPEPVRLHLDLQPLWGVHTLASAVGPTVTVSLGQ